MEHRSGKHMRRIDVIYGGAIIILALVLSGIVLGYIPGPWAPETVTAAGQ